MKFIKAAFLLVFLQVAIFAASSAPVAAQGDREIVPGKVFSFITGDMVVEVKTGETIVGAFQIEGGKQLFGAVKGLTYKVKGKDKKLATEQVVTLETNVKGAPDKFEKSAEISKGIWYDQLVLADEVPLNPNSFWVINQTLSVDGKVFANLQIRFTPDAISIVSKPIVALTAGL